jgi:hypothetical protein
MDKFLGVYDFGDYDTISKYEIDIDSYLEKKLFDIDTKKFTNLNDVEILNYEHPFFNYFNGYIHNLENYELFHAYYHIPTKTVKFYIKCSTFICLAICYAWKLYWKNENINVYFYKKHCGELYKDMIDLDNKSTFYKELITKFLYNF